MKNFNTIWKEKAHNKQVTREDMLTYCLVKAIKAKEENKKALAEIFIYRSFKASGKKNEPFEALRLAKHRANFMLKFKRTILGVPATDLLTIEEIDLFQELLA